jgi:hypothetical protein
MLSSPLRRPRLRGALLLALAMVVAVPVSSAWAGRLIATGHDADFHCMYGSTASCHFLTVSTDYVRAGAPTPTKPVLVLDRSGGVAATALAGHGVPVVTMDPSSIDFSVAGISTDLYSAIVVASDSTCGGCDLNMGSMSDSDGINARTADIHAFFNAGGGVLALSGAAHAYGPDGTYYSFLPIPVGGTAVSPPFTLTSSGTAMGLTSDDVNCCPTHNSFTSPDPDSALHVAETDGSGNAETLVAEGQITGGTDGGGGVIVSGPPADTTAPTVSCDSADGSWHADNVSIACTASDSESGLAHSEDASFTLTTTVASGAEDANASTGSHDVCDVAGSCATAGPVAGNQVDRKAPTITLTNPGEGDSYLIGSSHAASFSCADGGSLVATCLGTVADGADVDTAAVGPHTFTVDSTDNVGNASPQASASYSVVWPYNGFLAPVDNKDTSGNYVLNRAKAGSAIPIKFNLGGDRGLGIMAAGSPTSGAIACSSTASTDSIEDTVTAGGSSLSYDSSTGNYVYVWKTDKAWAGTCRQFTAKLADGTVHKASFTFTK